eukprot:CAMPEP_0202956312 /NCGR_PEP_ID=MMETSP1396-20130829/810_1 /ASSEMBLY_ACC=CAM_ASM_000872 /TAXON_ID= /ORGANISM="Pseudokeronopsis sp., Strain Brazil" /LENGTH=117 /DNA_ID=CAMNT_0049673257 /DNA_START=529 /DNA_END=882 /DNA_ORIENTATION=+
MAYSSVGYFWKKSVQAYQKSGEAISYVGGSIQTTLDETGVPQGVSYYSNKAVEQSKNLGSSIYETSNTAVSSATGNEYVANISEKSKNAVGAVGGALSGATWSFYNKLKTYVVEEEE